MTVNDLKQRAVDTLKKYGRDEITSEDFLQAMTEIAMDIAILPDNWKPFDKEKPETWPDREGHYLIACSGCVPVSSVWDGMMEFWPILDPFNPMDKDVYAYMRLPDPPPEPERKP